MSLTKKMALKQTIRLWEKIAREADWGYIVRKDEVPGPWQTYKHNCPCCEYVYHCDGWDKEGFLDCNLCPMLEQWRGVATHKDNYHCICEDEGSPYNKWLDLIDLEYLCPKVAQCARLIAGLAKVALMELEPDKRGLQ